MSAKLTDVPEGLNEEYYQITADILGSFSKYRPPVNLYRFVEDVARISLYYKTGDRLSNERVEELSSMVDQGLVFVSRQDHPVYVKHMSHQLDLVLLDKNLKESEIADIFVSALTMRLEQFFEQPVRPAYEKLRDDILVLTEYLWSDMFRIKTLMKRLVTEHSLAGHSINSGIVGLALYSRVYAEDFKNDGIKRKTFDSAALGFFLHDLGMAKIPAFIRGKAQPLTIEEQSKIQTHVQTGSEMLLKLDVRSPEIEKCVREHHERMDGSGYPMKLRGPDLTVIGRLCAVADSFSAMIAKRPYAEARPLAEAANALAQDEKHYDPKISRLLVSLILTGK